MQEQKKFKYVYNGKEVDRKQFEELTSDSFRYFDGDSIVSVPFSSFDSFFDGEFKSGRQINDHLNSVLDVYRNKVTGDIINKPKCSPQCYCDGSCKKQKENPFKVLLKDPQSANILRKSIMDGIKTSEKDDIITSSNRGEKETIEHLQGVKENQEKQKAPIFTYCKVNKNALEALAFRALYGHEKYKEFDEDWQNFSRVPNGDFEYSNAQFRHALEIGGEETEEEHLVASAWNAVARLEIFLRNKSK